MYSLQERGESLIRNAEFGMRNYASDKLGGTLAIRRVDVHVDHRRPRLPMEQRPEDNLVSRLVRPSYLISTFNNTNSPLKLSLSLISSIEHGRTKAQEPGNATGPFWA